MSAASSRILLTLCVAVISLPALVPSQVAIDSGSVCSAEDDAGPARLSVIREEIISKLSHFLSFNVTSQWREVDVSLQNETRRVDPALVTAYEAVSRVLAEEDSAEPTGCAKADRGRGTPVFAKRLSLFFAVNASAYVPGKQDEDTKALFPTGYKLIFNPTLPSQHFYSAELRLFKKITPRCKDVVFENVEVFYVERLSNEKDERTLVLSKNVELFDEEYESFDVSTAVKKWISNDVNDSLELEVVINCPYSMDSDKFLPPSIEFHTDDGSLSAEFEDTRPQLVVATVTDEAAAQIEQQSRRRRRRQVVDSAYCGRNPKAIHCCIRRLVLNFHTDLNLPWILYPPTFSPNYCRGMCPVPFLGESSLRLNIQRFYQTNELGGGPCCAIYSMAPLLMLIEDQWTGTVMMLDVPDMEITSCGCVD